MYLVESLFRSRRLEWSEQGAQCWELRAAGNEGEVQADYGDLTRSFVQLRFQKLCNQKVL